MFSPWLSLVAVFFWAADGETPVPLPATLSDTLFLTWEEDPTSSMTFVWFGAPESPSQVAFRPRGKGDWITVSGQQEPFPDAPWLVNHVTLSGLTPDTEYEYRREGTVAEAWFRTAPQTLTEPLRIVSGGDAGPNPPTRRVCRHAAARDPLFALIGGDLAYAGGRKPLIWVRFLNIWHQEMETNDGRTIPMVVCIGNHETRRDRDFGRARAPYFYTLFRLFDDKKYTAMDFGDYLSLILLDSGHTTTVLGPQTDWLRTALATRREVPHLFAVYHVPAYPSFRPLNDATSVEIRQHWIPLLEEFGVDVAFEHHDHTYKRAQLPPHTPGEPGLLLLGDGAWGVDVRQVKDAREHAFLDASAGRNHFILTELRGLQHRTHLAIDDRGELFDSYPQPELKLTMKSPGERRYGRPVHLVDTAIDLELELGAMQSDGTPITSVSGHLYAHQRSGWSRRVGAFRFEEGGSVMLELSDPEAGRTEFWAVGSYVPKGQRPVEFAAADLLRCTIVDLAPQPGLPTSASWATSKYECRVFEGSWRTLPDFDTLEPVATHEVSSFDVVAVQPRPQRYGLQFKGTFLAPTAGLYHFVVRSDDGSFLRIGGHLVVDNDGRHPLRERHGWISLAKGPHALEVSYLQYRTEAILEIWFEGPEIPLTRLSP